MAVNSFNAQNPPVTTKGDVFTFSTIPTRLGVGANNTVLTADSGEATGLKWATPSSGGMTSLATGTLSGTEVSLTSISGTYQTLFLSLSGVVGSSATPIRIRINNVSTSDYRGSFISAGGTAFAGLDTRNAMPVNNDTNIGTAATNAIQTLTINQYASTGYKTYLSTFSNNNVDATFGISSAAVTAAITSIQIRLNGTATFSAGTYTLYGVK